MPLTQVQSGMMDSVAQYYSFKNRLINGAMIVDQRNNGVAQTPTLGANAYTLDRWFLYSTGATVTTQQVAGIGGYQAALRITGSSSNTGSLLAQRIEQRNCFDLAGQNVTVSVTLVGSTSGSVTWNLGYAAGGADTWSGTTSITSGTISFTTTVTTYTFTVAVPSAATTGLQLYFDFGAVGSGVTRTITGVQLEKGVTATSFDYRPYGTELQLCQRYCYAINPNISVIGPASAVIIPVYVPASLRTAPTLNAPYTNATYTSSGAPTGTQWNAQQLGIVAASVTGTITVNPISIVNSNLTGFYITGATFSLVPNWISSGASVPNIIASAEL